MPSKRAPIVIGILCLVAAVLVTQLRIDNRRERMLDQNTPAALAYHEFQREFGNDLAVIVAVSGKPLFEFESLDAMVEAADRLAKVPRVSAVNGIPSIFRETFNEEDNEALEEEMTNTPFYEGLFISRDHTVAGIVVELTMMDSPGANAELVAGIEEAIRPLRDLGFRVDLIGDPVFTHAIDVITMSESLRMFPIAAVLSLAVLVWLLRSVRATAVVLICNAVILLLTMGTMQLSRHTLNLVTASLPLMLWVLSLANSIHVVSRFQQLAATIQSKAQAITSTMEELRGSLTMSSITTALGFVSLMTTNVSAIRALGLYMAIGMMIMLLISLYLAPWLCLVLKVPAAPHIHKTSRLLERWGRVVTRRPYPLLAMFVIAASVAVYAMLQVKTQPDSFAFLPKKHPVVQSSEFVANRLTALHSMEVVLDTPGGWTNPQYWPALSRLIEQIQQHEFVSRAFGPFDFVKKINQWEHDFDPAYYRLPESREQAEELLDLMPTEDRRQLQRFESKNGERIRLSVLLNSRGSDVFDDIIHLTERELAALPKPMRGQITGLASRMHEFEFGLVKTQARSYGSSLLMVFIVVLIGMRSPRMTFILFPPNVFPLLIVFMIMGFFQISLDVATVMVASVSLGIAVDETILLLSYYRHLRAHGVENLDAIPKALADVGPACVVTSAVACIGFFTLGLSTFVPISNFGILCGTAMLTAVMANLAMTPAMLALQGNKS